MTGMLLASGRRTVTSWLRAVGVRVGYEEYYYFISSIGRNAGQVALPRHLE